jgi:hypothetical protein
MRLYEIPVQPRRNQRLRISLGGTFYWLTLTWNAYAGCWQLHIDSDQEVRLLSSLAVVTGLNILEQFDYLNIGNGGMMVAQADHAHPDDIPAWENLGETTHLFWIDR